MVLQKAKSGTSPGYDGINSDFLKLLVGARAVFLQPANLGKRSDGFAAVLVHLVNAMLRTGVCPSGLKKGLIALLPKPGKDKSVASNRRPISLLPKLGKLTNRILAHRFVANPRFCPTCS